MASETNVVNTLDNKANNNCMEKETERTLYTTTRKRQMFFGHVMRRKALEKHCNNWKGLP